MSHITLTDSLAILQLVYYSAALLASIWVSARHGLAKSSGWIFLAIFSIIRVVGCSAQISTIISISDTAVTIATITTFLGISPLLLAALGIISRVYFSMLEAPWRTVFSMGIIKVVQVPAAVALILCIVGATSADSPAGITTQATVKVGVAIFLAVLVVLSLLVAGAALWQRRTGAHWEGKLLAVVAASLPILLVRLINSFLLLFSTGFQTFTAKNSTGSVMVEFFMARVEEMVIVLMYLWAGFTHQVVPNNKDTTKRTKREEFKYRAERGDFGGGKLGMISLTVATILSMFREREPGPETEPPSPERILLRQRETNQV